MKTVKRLHTLTEKHGHFIGDEAKDRIKELEKDLKKLTEELKELKCHC